MKKIILFFLVSFIYGCGPTLQELRSFEPIKTDILDKDAFCVYSKISMNVLSENLWDCPSWPRVGVDTWHNVWDPQQRVGEIFFHNLDAIGLPYFVLYKIEDIGTATKIEIRAMPGGGACFHPIESAKNIYVRIKPFILECNPYNSTAQ